MAASSSQITGLRGALRALEAQTVALETTFLEQGGCDGLLPLMPAHHKGTRGEVPRELRVFSLSSTSALVCSGRWPHSISSTAELAAALLLPAGPATAHRAQG